MNKYRAISKQSNKLMKRIIKDGVLLSIVGNSDSENPLDFIGVSDDFIEATSYTLALNTYLLLDFKNIVNLKDTITYKNILKIFKKRGITENEFMVKLGQLEIKTMAMLALNLDTNEQINEAFTVSQKYRLYKQHFKKVKGLETYEGSLEYLENSSAFKNNEVIDYVNDVYENNIAANVSDDEFKMKYLNSYIKNVGFIR